MFRWLCNIFKNFKEKEEFDQNGKYKFSLDQDSVPTVETFDDCTIIRGIRINVDLEKDN